MNPFKAVANWIGGFFDKRLWTPIGGRKTTSHEVVSEDSALNYSAVWCATRLLCGTGASLPLPIYSGLGTENREKARKHPLFRLLNGSPNPEQTAYNFRSVMWQWQANWGNAYAEIQREGDDPSAPLLRLWPIHPERVKVCRDKETDELFYEVRDEYTREWVEVEQWRMFHLPSIITYDGISGHGVIQHARESIGAGIAAEKFGAHTFVAGVPRVAVEHPGMAWNPDARKAFREEWDEIYGGADKSRVAIIQGGAKLVPLNFSAEDQQFLETRQFGVEEIARWYGIPPHMLQHLLRATFNNIEHLGINFVQYSLIPWLRTWEQCIWKQLLTEREQEEFFAEHTVDALLRGDNASRASYYQTMTNAALMTRNEVRKLENLPPIPGGDVFLVQGAMVPLGEDGKPQSEFANANGEGGGGGVDLKAIADSYGVAVRSGLVTPQMDDESFFRTVADLPALSPDVAEKWTEEPTRRPITLVKPGDPQAEQMDSEDDGEDDTESSDESANESTGPPNAQNLAKIVAGRVKRILAHDLGRLLTKESKAILNHAKKPEKFVQKVDSFYSEHHVMVTDAVAESLAALTDCGCRVEAELFVATWITEGKTAVLEAAGAALAVDLPQVISSVVESKTWSERPIRAIERVENAIA